MPSFRLGRRKRPKDEGNAPLAEGASNGSAGEDASELEAASPDASEPEAADGEWAPPGNESVAEAKTSPDAEAYAWLESSEGAAQQEGTEGEGEWIHAEAERRISEVEELQKWAEERAALTRSEAEERVREVSEEATSATEERGAPDEASDEAASSQLREMEQRLLEGQRRTEESLHQAVQRIEEVEARAAEAEAKAAEAEARAASAEHLAELRRHELESERRLRETLERVGAAEARTRAAEERARRAATGVNETGAKLEERTGPEREGDLDDWTPPTSTGQRLAELALRVSERPPTPTPPPGPEPPAPPGPEPEVPAPGAEGLLNINQATYEELRSLNLSVSQAGRVLAYRERTGGFTSLEELDQIPGFSNPPLTELKRKLTAH